MEGVALSDAREWPVPTALHGPFGSEQAAREHKAALGGDRASVLWPTTGDEVRGFMTTPPTEFEPERFVPPVIDLPRDQWSAVEGVPAALRDA
jgi:hypothetical protein